MNKTKSIGGVIWISFDFMHGLGVKLRIFVDRFPLQPVESDSGQL